MENWGMPRFLVIKNAKRTQSGKGRILQEKGVAKNLAGLERANYAG